MPSAFNIEFIEAEFQSTFLRCSISNLLKWPTNVWFALETTSPLLMIVREKMKGQSVTVSSTVL